MKKMKLTKKNKKELKMICGVLIFFAVIFIWIVQKARPATIERELGLSKAAFKRAVGRLLKDGLITITDNGILKK